MDFSNVNFNHIDTRIDENIKAMPPINNTDPNSKFEGFNFGRLLSLLKPKRSKVKREKEYYNTSFPKEILQELGEDFFFKDLKIPKEKYQHFLEYCDIIAISSIYKKGKLLQVIQILQDNSVTYLKSINKNDTKK